MSQIVIKTTNLDAMKAEISVEEQVRNILLGLLGTVPQSGNVSIPHLLVHHMWSQY